MLFARSRDGELQYAGKISISFQTSGGGDGIPVWGRGEITPGTLNEFHQHSPFPPFLV